MKKIYSVLLFCGFIFSWCSKKQFYQEWRYGRMQNFARDNGLVVFKIEIQGKNQTNFSNGAKSYANLRRVLEEFPTVRDIPCSYCRVILANKESYDLHQVCHRMKNKKSRQKEEKRIHALIGSSSNHQYDGLHLLLAAALIDT